MTFLKRNSFVDKLRPTSSLRNKLLLTNFFVKRQNISEMMPEKATTRRLEALHLTCRTPGEGGEKSLEVMVVVCISCRQFS